MADRVVSYDFRGNFTNLTAGLTATGRSVQDLGTKMTALDKSGAQMRRGLDTVGRTAGRMGLAAAAGLGAVVAVTANFEQAISKVAATGDDARGSLDALRQAALDAGAATAFSATEAAAGIENLLKAGVSAQDVLGGGLAGALDLAAAGGLEVADAAEIAATALTQFQLSGDDVPHIADLLAAGAGKAQGDVSDLGMALKQAGLVAAQTGLTLEETTGTLSAFASAGLLGSDAGTSFKTMLQSLTPSSAKAREEMERLGITAYDAQGNFVGMTEFAGNLRAGLADLSVEQQNAAMKTIFGSDAVRAASVVFEQGADGIQDWIDKTNDAGYAAETAATRMDNLKGDLEELRGSLETALIGSGEGSTGILREMTQGLTDLVNAFNELPAPMKNATTGMLAITAITGGALWFGSKVVTGIVDTKQALSDLGITVGRTGVSLKRLTLTAGGIAAVAGAVTILGNELAKATGAKINTSDLQRDLEALAGGRNGDLVKRVADDIDYLGQTFNSAAEPLHELASGFGLLGNTIKDNSAENIENIDQALAGLVESGNADQATEMFERIVAGAMAQGLAVGEVTSQFDAYNTARENAAAASLEADAADDGLRAGLEGLATSYGVAEGAADGLNNSLEAGKQAAQNFETALESLTGWLDKREAMRSFNDSVRELGKSIKNGFGREDVENLDNIGRNIVQVAESIKDKELRADFLAGARESLRDLADKAGPKAQREIEGLIRQLKILERQNPTVTVDTTAAERGINRLRTALSNIPDEEVFVSVRRKGGDQPQLADGGTVTGQRYPYADKRLYLLAPGEEVISNRYGQADRNRTLLKMINANRAADGATVGWERRVPMASSFTGSSGAGVSIDYDRLASAVANARPPQLYGDVHVSDGYGGFKRAMMEDRARANFDGVRN